MAQTHARGNDVWIRLDDVKQPTNVTYSYFGQSYVLKPFTRYGSILFISGMGDGQSLYVQNDELKSEKTSLMIKAENIDIAVKRALSVAGVIQIYRVTVKFMIYALPGGPTAARTVTAFSVAVFFQKHRAKIDECLAELRMVVACLQVIFSKYPKLGMAMLCAALEEGSGQLSAEVRKKGLARFVIDGLDWGKFVEDVAALMGALLHAAVGEQHKPGKVVNWALTKLGLEKLLTVITHLYDIYKKVKRVLAQARNVADGPPIKDKPALATSVVTAFADAGVKLSQEQALAIVEENSIFDVGPDQERTASLIVKAKAAAENLEKHVTRLAEAADAEIF